jgi:beta-glucosidase
MSSPAELRQRPWTDASRPLSDRVEALLGVMTIEEKVAQLSSVWIGGTVAAANVAPQQAAFARDRPFEEATQHGLGHLTRVFGTAPVDPGEGMRKLAELQSELVGRTRLGIPAIAHEECLTGFTTLGATVFPAPLAMAATFDVELVQAMATRIGEGMRAVGVHQGLSPVVDVVRDYRWGRVEETFGEDPYLVGSLGAAYVRGLEAAGIVATLKHFVGYSASRSGRNLGPAPVGPRELQDVLLPPFERAVRDGARAVMHSYSEVDGVPAAAHARLLTDLLRDEWGFPGVVVADYWGIAFLQSLHRVAGSPAEAGAKALAAGVDVELPDSICYPALAGMVQAGELAEELVDRAVRRVLRQKGELGLLDADWAPVANGAPVELDPPENRAIARALAERSVILLHNDGGVLPLADGVRSLAVVGPCAADALTLLGCYSFPSHVLAHHPDVPPGIEIASVLEALGHELPAAAIAHEPGCPVQEPDPSGIAAAVELARGADVCVAVVGDRAGLFGRGTSGEGCDVEDLELPGAQSELLDALLDTGARVVIVVVSGRPYALGRYAPRAAAIVQAFFPGQEGAGAVAGVLSGRVVPSGRLPVEIPARPGGQPATYLHPLLGGNSGGVSATDPTALYPFGHGLSYTRFTYGGLTLSREEVPTDGELEVSCTVANAGERCGTETVQLYLGDPLAEVTRPLLQLAGFHRVQLDAGERAEVSFRLHADRTAFTSLDLKRVVEPGAIEVMVGPSSRDLPLKGTFTLTGERRVAGHDRVLSTPSAQRELRRQGVA